MNLPRVVIAGVKSGVGKTSIAAGLMSALAEKGIKVQGFKVGPDYIDPTYHAAATGRPSRNLDSFLVPPEAVLECFARAARDADVAVVEGVMGLFDGKEPSGRHSTAEMARLLRAPVLLVVDVSSMGQSAAAVVEGYRQFDPRVKVAGVILNRVAGERHLRLVQEAVEKRAGVPVVGAFRREELVPLPQRHLGLVPAVEKDELAEAVKRLGEVVGSRLDLDRIMELAGEAGPLPAREGGAFPREKAEPRVRIGIARDAAFHFYYQDSLELLEAYGAELVAFSPLEDRALPPGIAGLYIGGGFPELFLERLASNQGLIQSLRAAAAGGLPIYAECGGLMYLCQEVQDAEGRAWPMVGLVPAVCRMEKKLVAMGYRTALCLRPNLLLPAGGKIRGHEFHYSRLERRLDPFPWAYSLEGPQEGYAQGNLLATYLHVHFVGCPGAAENFIRRCREYAAG
jgi:cobyrinic acid a,c-diamide synthase